MAPKTTHDDGPGNPQRLGRAVSDPRTFSRTARPSPLVAPLLAPLLALGLLVPVLQGCSPTVKVEAPDKPIVINLNVKIEQEVRVKVDRDVDSLVKSNPNLF